MQTWDRWMQSNWVNLSTTFERPAADWLQKKEHTTKHRVLLYNVIPSLVDLL